LQQLAMEEGRTRHHGVKADTIALRDVLLVVPRCAHSSVPAQRNSIAALCSGLLLLSLSSPQAIDGVHQSYNRRLASITSSSACSHAAPPG
jgi:hypothetical protein